jgi:hypothetical protein
MMIRAVILKQILWPQRQEDRNEGGWLAGDEKLRSSDRARETIYRRASAIQKRLNSNTKVLETRKVTYEEEIPVKDRADYALKEEQKDTEPTRGRRRDVHV